jgi:hypothetical protein
MYLFQNQETDLYAYSVDMTGANIPPFDGPYRWLLRNHTQEVEELDGWGPDERVGLMDDLMTLGFHLFTRRDPIGHA